MVERWGQAGKEALELTGEVRDGKRNGGRKEGLVCRLNRSHSGQASRAESRTTAG